VATTVGFWKVAWVMALRISRRRHETEQAPTKKPAEAGWMVMEASGLEPER
jgi:hypothetical protein